MTQAKARQVVDALLQAGYLPTIKKNGDVYSIFVVDNDGGVNVNTVKTFADNQQITAKAQAVEYI